MGSPVATPRRIGFLDGLRGFACLQVVLSHFLSAFYPGIEWQNPTYFHYAWERRLIDSPLVFFSDGYLAVCVFFLISGAALTYSFEAMPRAVMRNILRRVVRLGIPIICSAILAFILYALFPHANLDASRAIKSPWLGFAAPEASVTQLLRDIFANSLFLGYQSHSFFKDVPGAVSFLQPDALSLNGLLWTMHVEFYGSILIILLTAFRAMNVWLYRGLLLVSALVWIVHPMILFVIGHLCARMIVAPRFKKLKDKRALHVLSLGLIAAGMVEIVPHNPAYIEAVGLFFWPKTIFHSFDLQAQLGAILVFGGTILCLPLQKLLETRFFRATGRISYSLYLVHLPILYTIVSTLAVALHNGMPYGAMTLLMLAALFGLSLGAAVLFERCVDRPAISLSRTLAFGKRA